MAAKYKAPAVKIGGSNTSNSGTMFEKSPVVKIKESKSLISHSINEKAPELTVEELIFEMVRDQWEDSDLPIKLALQQIRDASPPIWQPQFPSQPSNVAHDVLNLDCQWLHPVPAPGKLFWSRDLALYIAEPFAERPVMEKVKIVDVSQPGSDNRRIAVIASSDHSLAAVRSQYLTTTKGGSSQEILEHQRHSLLCAVLQVAKVDLTDYIKETTLRVQEIDMLSRRSPSTSQVQYLLHVRECLACCVQVCRDNASLARREYDKIELPASQYLRTIRDNLLALSMDLEYLAEVLDSNIQRVDEVKQLANEQMEIFDKRRNRIIGLLIAVYVPLAFTTSFFSMAIEDNSTASYWTNTTARNEEWNDLTPQTYKQYPLLSDAYLENDGQRNWSTGSNATWIPNFNWTRAQFEQLALVQREKANVTANLGSVTWTTSDIPGGTITWPMWMFWTVAFTLVLGSIVLPIVGGRVLRYVVRSSIVYRLSFRTIASLLWLMLWVYAVTIKFPEYRRSGFEDNFPLFAWILLAVGILLTAGSILITFVSRRFWACGSRVVFLGILIANALQYMFVSVWVEHLEKTYPNGASLWSGGHHFYAGRWVVITVVTIMAWIAALCRWIFARPGESW